MYVNTKTAGDIAITAAEGGIGYWSQILVYVPTAWMNWDTGETQQVKRDFVFYRIAESYDGTDGYAWDDAGLCHNVTPEVIQRGVNLYLHGTNDGPILYGEDAPASIRGQVNFKPRPFADMDDLSAMDSDEADIVIQLGLFGKLVYG